MSTNEEVRQHASFVSSRPAVLCKYLSGKEKSCPWYGRHFKAGRIKKRVEILDAGVANGELGVDRVIDQQWSIESRGLKLGNRPICPVWIVRNKVEQNVGIDERHDSPRVSAMIASVESPSPA